MSERYVIEFGGQHYGLLVLEERHFVFHASHPAAARLDQAQFPTVRAALHAVKQLTVVKAA